MRWGGEEFLLVFQPLPQGQAPQIAERLVRSIERHPFTLEDGRKISLTASLGLCPYPLSADTPAPGHWELTAELADKALYSVKRRARNGWCLALPRAPESVLRGRIDAELNVLQDEGLIDLKRSATE